MEKIFIKNRKNIDICVVPHFPEQPPKGLVFVQHGFSGHKDEVEIKHITETFCEKGYITVAFDATNSVGEGGCDAEGITFSGHYHDLEDVVNWAQTQDWYQEPFILCGQSLGGMSVIYYTEQHPDKVKLLIPIAPRISGKDFVASRKRRDVEGFAAWERTGSYSKTSSSTGRTMVIPFNFVVDILKYDCVDLSGNIKIPTVFILSENDQSISEVTVKRLYDNLNCPKELHVIADEGHVIRSEKGLADLRQLLLKTIDTYAD